MTTQPTPQYPHRHRLYGGRNTHATRTAPGMPYGIAACHKPITGNDWPQDDNTPITCSACIREMNR